MLSAKIVQTPPKKRQTVVEKTAGSSEFTIKKIRTLPIIKGEKHRTENRDAKIIHYLSFLHLTFFKKEDIMDYRGIGNTSVSIEGH